MADATETPQTDAHGRSPRPPRHWLRPRFSVAALFAVMTLACVGVWYWYQWPYAVEHVDSKEQIGSFARGTREVEYVRNIWSRDQQTVRRGPWALFDGRGRTVQEGYYRNGAKDGAFVRYDAKGKKLHEDHYASGVPHGPSRRWSEGRLVEEKFYEQGILHGPSHVRGTLNLELHYEHGQLDGPYVLSQPLAEGVYRAGKPDGSWTYRTPQNGQLRGKWKNGMPTGVWKLNGPTILTMRFADGRLTQAQPDNLEPRLAELLAQGKIHDPKLIRSLFSTVHSSFQEVHFMDVLWPLARFGELPIVVRHGHPFDADARVTQQFERVPVIAALRRLLEPRRLVCDYRYGVLRVTTPEEAIKGDTTGIEKLVPPRGSPLSVAWERPAELEFVETPLRDALNYLELTNDVQFDASELPTGARDMLVTMNIKGIAFKHCLGNMLDQLQCRASLRGETIVIELQSQPPKGEN